MKFKSLYAAFWTIVTVAAVSGAFLPNAVSADTIPTCSLSAAPSGIVEGNSSVLSWYTTGATDISIDNGIGDVNASDYEYVDPTHTTTYTLTASNSTESITCSETVTVLPENSEPTCSFTINPSTVEYGDSATFEWETLGANSVYINNGIGYVNEEGSMVLNGFYQDATYTLTAVNNHGTQTCNAYVNVDDADEHNYLAPTCSISATPESVSYNGSVILTWTSNGGSSASLNNGIGAVQKYGNRVVGDITDTTTFKLSVTNSHGTNTCSTTVYEDTMPGGPAPTCTISVTPGSFPYTGNAVLSWHGYHANSADITGGIGSVPMTGELVVSPSNSTNYVMTVHDTYGRVGYCSTNATIQGGIVGSGYGSGVYSGNTVGTIPLINLPYTGASEVLYVLIMLLVALGSVYTIYKYGRELRV